jgi:hypothetical protein
MSETISKRLLRERDDRIIGYVKKKMTSQEIADREGLEADYARKQRNELALTRLGIKKVEETKREPKPYGITEATKSLRWELGNQLYRLMTSRKLHHGEIARDIGIPMNHQKVAHDSKEPLYNWKLSQIERMAKMLNIHPIKLLVRAMRRELIKLANGRRVGELVDEWVYGED